MTLETHPVSIAANDHGTRLYVNRLKEIVAQVIAEIERGRLEIMDRMDAALDSRLMAKSAKAERLTPAEVKALLAMMRSSRALGDPLERAVRRLRDRVMLALRRAAEDAYAWQVVKRAEALNKVTPDAIQIVGSVSKGERHHARQVIIHGQTIPQAVMAMMQPLVSGIRARIAEAAQREPSISRIKTTAGASVRSMFKSLEKSAAALTRETVYATGAMADSAMREMKIRTVRR